MMANDKRLIDADALLMNVVAISNSKGQVAWSAVPTMDILTAPAVDAIEVVRCKDCKWYMPGELFTDIMFCHRLKKENGKPAKYNFCDDDFCSYGERRTDG